MQNAIPPCFPPQLQNQEALRVHLKRAEQEISVKLAEAMRRLEDPVQRQRALVEEDRHKYLGLEERVLTQLRYGCSKVTAWLPEELCLIQVKWYNSLFIFVVWLISVMKLIQAKVN